MIGDWLVRATDDLGKLAHPVFSESTMKSLGLLSQSVVTGKKKGKLDLSSGGQ